MSKLKGLANVDERNDMIFRADKIDLKSLDVQLEKHLSRVWSSNVENQNQRPREGWEIDPSKLEIRYLVAQGTYGTVHRGTYDNQDVAGKTLVAMFVFYDLCCYMLYCDNYWDLICRRLGK